MDLFTATDLLAATTPDSSLALRLALIRIADNLHLDLQRMKMVLPGILDAKAMRDMKSRAAAMFDESIHSEIMVTEPD